MRNLPFDRYRLLDFLPKNSTCAEIGVAKGKYSRLIVQKVKPNNLYLIDAWQYFDPGYKDTNINSLSQEEHDRRHQQILNEFKTNTNVHVIRKMSDVAVESFSDEYFDWIFVDADHSYEGCLRDLSLYDSKVKDNGYILGHDWIPDGKHKEGFGVKQAVRQFIEDRRYILTALTHEGLHQTYVISKNEQSNEAFNLSVL